MQRNLIETTELSILLEQNQKWDSNGKALSRDFEFSDFKEAFSFLSQVALISEELNHHAEIWNVYNKVTLKLSTHDTVPAGGGLTSLDFDFIKKLQQTLEKNYPQLA